jgi:hypothetical protein
MEDCVRFIKAWMSEHDLKMNDSKTEFMLLANKNTARQLDSPSLSVCGHDVPPSNTARNIGVVIDTSMSLNARLTAVCNRGYRQLHVIAKMKKFMDRDSLERIIHAFITSRIDYCNAILHGVRQDDMQKIQRLQNAAARLFTGTKRREHITPVLEQLHWLPVVCRVKFKILVLVYKCLNNTAPSYLCELITRYVPARELRTVDQSFLHVPFTTSEFNRNNVFKYVGPVLVNNLPAHVRTAQSLEIFKARLKTHLFTMYFT